MHETVCQQDFTNEDQKETPQLRTGTARMEAKSSKIKLTQIKMNVKGRQKKTFVPPTSSGFIESSDLYI